MNIKILKSNTLLTITAVIWGFAFVAQRMGMDHVGPFTFNGIRFALGSLSLIPLILFTEKRFGGKNRAGGEWKTLFWAGGIAGSALFLGASLQQVGMVYTTAGNAGFITGLYVVIVPILGLFFRQRPEAATWIGAILAAAGLYFLSITDRFTIAFGDLLELIGAFFWAGHVLIIGWLTSRVSPLKLAFSQFAVCSFLSLLMALFTEAITANGVWNAAAPILYGGLCSVGIAYTLQVVAQKDAKPAHAAIILSMEAPFAAVGGWIVLNETLTGRVLFGCTLMMTGMLVSQLNPLFRSRPTVREAEQVL